MRSLPCFVYNKRVALFEHRGVFADQAEARANPLIRQRSVGSYFTMKCDHALKGAGDSKYNARDIKVIDHNRQTWKTITFMDALRNSGLFDLPNGELNDWGKRVLFPQYAGDAFTFRNLIAQYGTDVMRKFGVYDGGAAPTIAKRSTPTDYKSLFKGDLPITGMPDIKDKKGTTISDKKTLVEAIRRLVDDVYASGLIDAFKQAVENKRTGNSQIVKLASKRFTSEAAANDAKEFVTLFSFINSYSTRATDGLSKTGPDKGAYGGVSDVVNIPNIEKYLQDGVQVPIQLYILRPHQTFRMGAMIMGKGGEETGFTVFGNANFELSDEATTKTAIGHYTCEFLPHFPQLALACADLRQTFVGWRWLALVGNGLRKTCVVFVPNLRQLAMACGKPAQTGVGWRQLALVGRGRQM